MRRITILLLAMAMAFGSVCAAKADGIDIKAKGQWDFAFGWASNKGWAKSTHHERSGRNDDNFIARHRVRTQINFITSEYLQGVLMFEIGNLDWGRSSANKTGPGSGGNLDADGVNVETKRAYLDWMIPDTEVSVRMGIQGLKLPSTRMGSPVMDADVAGIVISSPINEMFSITGFWVRPFDASNNDGTDRSLDDETDIFGLLLPIKGDGWSVTPWGMWGNIGVASGFYNYLYANGNRWGNNMGAVENQHTHAWWVGFNFNLTMFDPLTFSFDAMYGDIHKTDLAAMAGALGNGGLGHGTTTEYGSRGWFLAATLDYKLDWGTPGIFGWYATGDKDDSNDSGQLGRMPIISTDGGFQPTSFGALGSPNIATEGMVMGSGTGTWGIGIQIAKMSFIEDLTHTLRFAYYRGTNDSDLVKKGGRYISTLNAGDMYLTDSDSVFEVNFDHEYKIYENLTALLELGWIHLSLDENVWNNNRNQFRQARGEHKDNNNAWKAQLQFQYKF